MNHFGNLDSGARSKKASGKRSQPTNDTLKAARIAMNCLFIDFLDNEASFNGHFDYLACNSQIAARFVTGKLSFIAMFANQKVKGMGKMGRDGLMAARCSHNP